MPLKLCYLNSLTRCFSAICYEWANVGQGPVDGNVSLSVTPPGFHGERFIQCVLPSMEFSPKRLANSFIHMEHSITPLYCSAVPLTPFIIM